MGMESVSVMRYVRLSVMELQGRWTCMCVCVCDVDEDAEGGVVGVRDAGGRRGDDVGVLLGADMAECSEEEDTLSHAQRRAH